MRPRIGHTVERHSVLPSTQARGWERLDAGAPHGTVIVADHQTAGRGRRGREWKDTPEQGLLCSVILRLGIDGARLPLLTAAGALAAAEACEEIAGVEIRLRWPNDLVVGDRKLGGVLAEARTTGAAETGAVLGIGINIGPAPEGMRTEGYAGAASLAGMSGRPVDRDALLEALCAALDRFLTAVTGSDPAPLREAWDHRCALTGRNVRIRTPSGPLAGRIARTDPLDGISIETSDGQLRSLSVTEVERIEHD